MKDDKAIRTMCRIHETIRLPWFSHSFKYGAARELETGFLGECGWRTVRSTVEEEV